MTRGIDFEGSVYGGRQLHAYSFDKYVSTILYYVYVQGVAVAGRKRTFLISLIKLALLSIICFNPIGYKLVNI